MKTKSIGFIGGGNMASSLMSGLIASGYAPQQIWVSDTNVAVLQAHALRLQVHTREDNLAVADAADVLVLAVKPQALREVCRQLAETVRRKQCLVVSIAAGVTQASLARWLGDGAAVVRCMPNTPALVLTGATALHANGHVIAEQKTVAENILRAVGLTLWVDDEGQLDVVTAISGSGPAYYFLLMEAMEKAAGQMGMDAQTARLLILQTALGAAKIALESAETPETLRERVTSPGGTTQQAIETFRQNGFVELVARAMLAARDRSIEMSEQLGAE